MKDPERQGEKKQVSGLSSFDSVILYMDYTSSPSTSFTSSPGNCLYCCFPKTIRFVPLFSQFVSLLLKNIPSDITSHNVSNTLACPYKRACIVPQGQFLKHAEITFLHRDVTQTHCLGNGSKQKDG